MTDQQANLMQKLAMSLDTCLCLVAVEASKELREGQGKSLRPITWQDRQASFPALVNEARDVLTASGKRVWF